MQNMPDWTDEPQEYDDGSTGIDPEEDDGGDILEPFDPTLIRVTRHTMTVDLLMQRLKYNELDLSPDFQREKSIWNEGAQSRLIESLLIRIPIPAFYFDATNDEKWLVIDGVQRLTAFARFIIDKKTLKDLYPELEPLKLHNLEFLMDLNGSIFENLPRPYQRRIMETQVHVYTIDPGTPPDVKSNIFKRINTGGLPLSEQEIRNALNTGSATKMLLHLSQSEKFLKAINRSIRDKRRADQLCILRFIAFTLSPYPEPEDQNFDFNRVLDNTMARMNRMSRKELEALESKFNKAMDAAYEIFGAFAFRRAYPNANINQINGALFEVWSVNLGKLSDDDIWQLIKKRAYVINALRELLRERDFVNTISGMVRRAHSVSGRFTKIEKFIQEILEEQDPWDNIEEKYPINSTVKGKVSNIVGFGVFVKLEKGLEGLIHTSELSWTERYPDPNELFSVGAEINAVVLEIDPVKGRISLSYKQTQPDPWELVTEKYSVGSMVQGRIVKIVNFGTFVELEKGVEGLIHKSELTPRQIQMLEDVVSVNDELSLKVIELDVNKRRIGFSLKAVGKKQPR